MRIAQLDRRRAVAHVAAAIALGRRRRQQHLLAAHPAHQRLMPGAAAAMPRDAGHLGLMHGENHRRRGAGAAEHVTNIDHVGDAGALAAEFARHHDAQQTLGAGGGDGLRRKPRSRDRRRRHVWPRSPQLSRRGRRGFRAPGRIAGNTAGGARSGLRAVQRAAARSWMHSRITSRAIAFCSRSLATEILRNSQNVRQSTEIAYVLSYKGYQSQPLAADKHVTGG